MNVMPPGIELGSSRTEGPTLTKSAIIALNLIVLVLFVKKDIKKGISHKA